MRLHAYCMVADVGPLNTLLTTYMNAIGDVATSLLVNRPLHVSIGPAGSIGVTAMMCAAMWNRQPAKVRLLYAYGARVDDPDCMGSYLEERLAHLPYFDHLRMMRGETSRLARRRPEDSSEILQELLFLAGEESPPAGWHPPPRLLRVPDDLVPGSG